MNFDRSRYDAPSSGALQLFRPAPYGADAVVPSSAALRFGPRASPRALVSVVLIVGHGTAFGVKRRGPANGPGGWLDLLGRRGPRCSRRGGHGTSPRPSTSVSTASRRLHPDRPRCDTHQRDCHLPVFAIARTLCLYLGIGRERGRDDASLSRGHGFQGDGTSLCDDPLGGSEGKLLGPI